MSYIQTFHVYPNVPEKLVFAEKMVGIRSVFAFNMVLIPGCGMNPEEIPFIFFPSCHRSSWNVLPTMTGL
jgi:hypothetical protein